MSQKRNTFDLYAAARKIKHAVNKEQAIENILNELDERFSKTQVIEWLEKYFRDEEEKRLDENFSRQPGTYSKTYYDLSYEPLKATDNAAAIEALGIMKKRLGV